VNLTEQEVSILLTAKAGQLTRILEVKGKDWKPHAGVIVDEMAELVTRLERT
jgi:hypothetical protein